ncbi:hypothetical protein BLNAU_20623 [Blattamonas nauphoetae]|uniref:Uncharacterized protein n=1 Tax=Blattamonas nauphoetae TaxID=2049346 RepID=A0ABQ9WYC9_9EUKA|nr:hypothetical protein BLNAU_20623 [Blattamonas nauphoetae]
MFSPIRIGVHKELCLAERKKQFMGNICGYHGKHFFEDNTAYTFLMLPEFDAFYPSHTPACAPTEEEVTERHGTLTPSFQRSGLEALFAAHHEPTSGGLFGNFSKVGQREDTADAAADAAGWCWAWLVRAAGQGWDYRLD